MKVLVMFGTRPEAIKLAPVIAELRRRPNMEVVVAVTAQHRKILDQVLQVFGLVPDIDLAVMRPSQSLAELSQRILIAVDRVLREVAPDLVVVQGDTTSAFVSGLSAFYRGVPVAHVEAGLRTESALSPFPEEMNRRLVSQVAMLHFAPTESARAALLREGVAPETIRVTGNPVVDALHAVQRSDAYALAARSDGRDDGERHILVTMHRRESWGAVRQICDALRRIAERRSDIRILFPVHPNPLVHNPVHEELGQVAGVTLTAPLDYVAFVAAMARSVVVLTDSGGVQEEAPVLGVPVLILRTSTERPEAVEHGVARLVGTDPDVIVTETLALLENADHRAAMSRPESLFGDGHAAARIADAIADRSDLIAGYAARPGNPRRPIQMAASVRTTGLTGNDWRASHSKGK